MRFTTTACLAGCAAAALTVAAGGSEPRIGERPAIAEHLDQQQIEHGVIELRRLVADGQRLFDARFNRLDGQGRPGSTGAGAPRVPDQPAFIRTSAPDANSCAGCHSQPRSGGAGDFVVNVFVLAQTLDPVTESVGPDNSNERNTLGMMGAGPIEMVAREMSAELIAIREQARADAAASGSSVRRELIAKGVRFGWVTVLPDGKVDPREIEGVDWDLIVKPFHQKGAVVSLREFTNNAMNHHHGMQSVERFGDGVDADGDGMVNELTVGDITATTLYQAALDTPVRVPPPHPAQQAAAAKGEQVFAEVGCASCHLPSLRLDDPRFTEPGPFNPSGNLRPEDTEGLVSFDMTTTGLGARLERTPDGGAIVRAFTDLKRHDLTDDDYTFFGNEQIPQGTLAGFAPASEFTVTPPPRPTWEFLTRKLWDVGNSMPYGHRGDLTTITDAIHHHGGDARQVRDAFFALPQDRQDEVVEFLRTLQVAEGKPAWVDRGAGSGGLGWRPPHAERSRFP